MADRRAAPPLGGLDGEALRQRQRWSRHEGGGSQHQSAARRLTSRRTDAEDHAGALISHHSKGHGPSRWDPPPPPSPPDDGPRRTRRGREQRAVPGARQSPVTPASHARTQINTIGRTAGVGEPGLCRYSLLGPGVYDREPPKLLRSPTLGAENPGPARRPSLHLKHAHPLL